MNRQELKRLEVITGYAEEIRTHLLDQTLVKHGKVHFRPTTDGITLVCLSPDAPQLGKGGFHAQVLAANLESLYEVYCANRSPGRTTPEKKLQSYLISDAYTHSLELNVLKAAAPDLASTAFCFITDELALYDQSRSKLQCDLLALLENDGMQIPVLIELKSGRYMTELIRQLEEYACLFNIYRTQLEALYSATLGQPVRFTAPPQKWIVWPYAGQARDPRKDELTAKGIRVVEYAPSTNGYVFRVGKPSSVLSR